MTALIISKYFHFIAIFVVFATLTTEHLLLKETMTRKEIKRLSIIDAVYGVSAFIVLALGLILWFVIGKPAQYYNHNMFFHIKLTLFVVAALISIYPTVYFLKNRKGNPEEEIKMPKSIVMSIRMELTLLVLIPLFAVLMANGLGAF